MIPWITTGGYLKGLLQYNEDKEEESAARLIHSNTHDNTVNTFKAQYKELTAESKRKHNLMHISLNFHPDDKPKLDPEFYKKITEEFLFEFGYPLDQPYVIYEHADKNHPHIHIAVPMHLTTGGVINNKFTARRMIKIARVLESKHGLKRVIEIPKLLKEKAKYGKGYKENLIALKELTSSVMQQRPASLSELDKVIERYPVIYNGEKAYLGYNIDLSKKGITFFLKNDNGEQIAKGIKGTKINNLSYPVFDDKLKTNASTQGVRIEIIKSIVRESLSNNERLLDFITWKSELKSQGIKIELFYTKDNDIFGLSFIDEITGVRYKASELDRKYSWAQLKKHFDPNTLYQEDINKTETKKQFKPLNEEEGMESVIKTLKENVDLIDLIERHGYQIDKTKSTASVKVFKGKDILLVRKDINTGLFYYNYANSNDKKPKDIFNFVVDSGIVSDFKEAVKYLSGPSYNFSKVEKTNNAKRNEPSVKKDEPFIPVRTYSLDENNYLVVDRGISIDIISKHFNGAIFSTTHDRLAEDLQAIMGDKAKYFIKKIKPNTGYTVIPLTDIKTGKIVGQQIRHNNIGNPLPDTSYKPLIKNSNKTSSIWSNYDASLKNIAVFENPIDAISHQELNPDFKSSYFGTIGNPSNEVIKYIAELRNKHTINLGGDNDLAGTYFNSRFLVQMMGNKLNTTIALSKDLDNVTKGFNQINLNFTLKSDKVEHQKLINMVNSFNKESSTHECTLNFNGSIDIDNINYSLVINSNKTALSPSESLEADQKALELLNNKIAYFYLDNVGFIKSVAKDQNADLIVKQKKSNKIKPKL